MSQTGQEQPDPVRDSRDVLRDLTRAVRDLRAWQAELDRELQIGRGNP